MNDELQSSIGCLVMVLAALLILITLTYGDAIMQAIIKRIGG